MVSDRVSIGFSYVDESRLDHEVPFEHDGFEFWLDNVDDIRAINTDVPA